MVNPQDASVITFTVHKCLRYVVKVSANKSATESGTVVFGGCEESGCTATSVGGNRRLSPNDYFTTTVTGRRTALKLIVSADAKL